jgi:hypothetical protein
VLLLNEMLCFPLKKKKKKKKGSKFVKFSGNIRLLLNGARNAIY